MTPPPPPNMPKRKEKKKICHNQVINKSDLSNLRLVMWTKPLKLSGQTNHPIKQQIGENTTSLFGSLLKQNYFTECILFVCCNHQTVLFSGRLRRRTTWELTNISKHLNATTTSQQTALNIGSCIKSISSLLFNWTLSHNKTSSCTHTLYTPAHTDSRAQYTQSVWLQQWMCTYSVYHEPWQIDR